jgi:hypothetical protein
MKYMARKYTFPSPSGKKPEPFKFSSPYPRRLHRFSVTEMNNILKRYRNKEPLRSIAEMYHGSPSLSVSLRSAVVCLDESKVDTKTFRESEV